MSYIVEIGNSSGQSFKIKLEVGFWGKSEGTWLTLDKGQIRFNSGWNKKQNSHGTLTTMHLLLFNSEDTWGIRLNDFTDLTGANNQGNGILLQSWSLGFQPDAISWILLD